MPRYLTAPGVIGCGANEPEPVVLGGVAVRAGVLVVVDGEKPVLVALLLYSSRQ